MCSPFIELLNPFLWPNVRKKMIYKEEKIFLVSYYWWTNQWMEWRINRLTPLLIEMQEHIKKMMYDKWTYTLFQGSIRLLLIPSFILPLVFLLVLIFTKSVWLVSDVPLTSLTEFRHEMRSGDLLAYLSLNCPSSGIVSCSWCYFVLLLSKYQIFQKFNLCVTDGRSNGPTDGPTDQPTEGHTVS